MYLRIFVILFDLILQYYFPKLMRGIDRGFKDQEKSVETLTKKKTHREYVAVYKNIHFEIERSYAELLNVIFFTCTYWLMLPHIFIPNTIFLLALYYKDKILSKKNENFNFFLRFDNFQN